MIDYATRYEAEKVRKLNLWRALGCFILAALAVPMIWVCFVLVLSLDKIF